MSTRSQLQNTKLSQRVADFVKCIIRGDLYDPTNLNILVQVTSTNPFEISDLHNYIQIKDPTVFLDKIKESNENLTVHDAKGGFFCLSKWNFVADMDPNSNKLKFDMVVEEVMFLAGQHTIEHPENPSPLFETAQVKSQLNRLKKFFIAQRFNQENPFDPTPIEEARYAISESIRKQSHIPSHFTEPSQLQDPFLLYNPPNDGKVSVSQSHIDEYEELSINSQNQQRVGDSFRIREQVRKPYNTMPAEAFGLNLDNLPNQPLIGGSPIPEAPEREEGSANLGDNLPTFGGDQAVDQNKEPGEVSTDKIENDGPKKRNFDDLKAGNPESSIKHAQQTTKAIKPTWGPNHHANQNDFKMFRDEKRALESKKSDPLDLLGLSESQEAEEFASHRVREEKSEVTHRPPETRFNKPLVEEDIEIEEEINKEKPKPQPAQLRVHSPIKTEKPKTNVQNSKDSKKSWSFGRSGGAADEEIEIIKHDKAQQLKQSVISDFTKKINKPTLVQQVSTKQTITTQTVNTTQYVTKELKYPPPQQGSNKKPVYKEQAVQIQPRKPQHEIYEIEDNDYISSFRNAKKPSPADKVQQFAQKQRFEAKPARRESGISMDYLRSFADLAAPKKSPAPKMIIENPIRAGSQIDLSEFMPVSAKKQQHSSSTIIQRSPKVPSIQASPAKFSDHEFMFMKKLYDHEVGK